MSFLVFPFVLFSSFCLLMLSELLPTPLTFQLNLLSSDKSNLLQGYLHTTQFLLLYLSFQGYHFAVLIYISFKKYFSWSSFLLSFMWSVNCFLVIWSFGANIHLSVNAYYVCSFATGLPHPG